MRWENHKQHRQIESDNDTLIIEHCFYECNSPPTFCVLLARVDLQQRDLRLRSKDQHIVPDVL